MKIASSGSGWGKCRATFAIGLGSIVRSQSKILKLETLQYIGGGARGVLGGPLPPKILPGPPVAPPKFSA